MSRELREPNEKLGAVLALAGISNAGLARRVNDLGAQRGLTLRYDKTSVARWVSKGMVPQGAAPHLIAAAIGAKLGRPVPLHEIGLADADPAPEVGLAFPRDIGAAVRSATDLYRLDLAGRRGGGGIWQSLAGSFSVSAYATPASRWLISPADSSVAREPGPVGGPRPATPEAPAPTAAAAPTAAPAPGSGSAAAPGRPSVTAAPLRRTPETPAQGLVPAHSGPETAPPAVAAAATATAPAATATATTTAVRPVPDASPQRVGHSDVAKLREAAEDARRWDSKYGGGDWRSSMVPECLRVDAAPLLLGSYSDEVGRALFGATAELTKLGRLDGPSTPASGGGAALLHPGAAPGPGGRRRPAGRVRAGLEGPPGDLPGLPRRGRGPGAGRRRAQPRPRHRPHDELLPPGRGAGPREGRRFGGRRGGAAGVGGLAGAVAGGRSRPDMAGFLLVRPFRGGCGRVLPGPQTPAPGAPLHGAGAVPPHGGVRTLARAAAGGERGRRAGVGQPGRGVRGGHPGRGGRGPDLLGADDRVRT
ncbi:sporulation associated protein [Streptomyces sp. C]|nr:sporulation associated protein [Streptomyces sp. C]